MQCGVYHFNTHVNRWGRGVAVLYKMQIQYYTSASLALRMLRQEDCEFEARLGYKVTPCIQNNKSMFQFREA